MSTSRAPAKRLDYVAQTRQAVVVSAEDHFVRVGFRAASIDAIAGAAGFTKGAVYRHFRDKEALFVEVFDRVETDTIGGLPRPSGAAPVDEDALIALSAFLHATTQTRYRRIVLEEGPVALGWRRWRELDHQHTAAYLESLLEQLVSTGAIKPRPLRPLARLCCATVGEAAILVAEAADPAAAEAEALEVLAAMLSGLRT